MRAGRSGRKHTSQPQYPRPRHLLRRLQDHGFCRLPVGQAKAGNLRSGDGMTREATSPLVPGRLGDAAGGQIQGRARPPGVQVVHRGPVAHAQAGVQNPGAVPGLQRHNPGRVDRAGVQAVQRRVLMDPGLHQNRAPLQQLPIQVIRLLPG